MSSTDQLKVIVTGATGMVGEGVVHTCLQDPGVKEVLVVVRRSMGLSHPKLKEIIHKDFLNIEPIADQLSGFDACYFCLGVSSVGLDAEQYYKMTYTLTMHFAEVLSRLNHKMVFCYVSGRGTDSSEEGSLRWARVKGKTENDLQKLPFKSVYNYRPGFIKPIEGMRFVNPWYKYIQWMFPLGRKFFAGSFARLDEIGRSMLFVTRHGYKTAILEGKDINETGK